MNSDKQSSGAEVPVKSLILKLQSDLRLRMQG